jgi:hypothetical protein
MTLLGRLVALAAAVGADIKALHAGKEPSLGNPDADGRVLSSASSGVRSWVAVAGSGADSAGLSMPGELVAHTGAARWYPPRAIVLRDITVFADTAPVSSALAINVRKNGMALFDGSMPTLAVGCNAGSALAVPSGAAAMTETDCLTVDVLAPGGAADMFVRARFN